jgi:hypothetical protein
MSAWSEAGMRLAVEPWAPEYGSPLDAEALEPSDATVDADVETPADAWKPLAPPAGSAPPDRVTFVDGVRRIDARVWITASEDAPRPGLLASYAAGTACCDGASAHVERVDVRRSLFARAGALDLDTRAGTYAAITVADDDIDQLSLEMQQRMRYLEREVALDARCDDGRDELVVLDGPLASGQYLPGAVGYIKTHRVSYLPPGPAATVARLAPGERTPLFVTRTNWSRWSWYLRLPGPAGHPWAGIVRCEASSEIPLAGAARLADRTALTLPRFASAAHKDPRAPQNLYPIAALERQLRHRLGDAAWVYRALRAAAGEGDGRQDAMSVRTR